MVKNSIEISIVVPVYNSSQTISEFVARVQIAMKSVGVTYELILTDDCSTDNSWQEISKICKANEQIIGLHLAKNCGQWCSTLAGMSMSSGKYIITIDDDLEYDPNDIPELYKAIAASNYSVVFGMAKDKYTLQGKSPAFSKLRNKLLNYLWNKQPTDSFKILERRLVFDRTRFLLREPFEVFIAHRIEKQFWGYCAVRFNRRHTGYSNYSISKKIKLFFLFSSYYILNPVGHLVYFSTLFIATIIVTFLLDEQNVHNKSIPIFMGAILVCILIVILYNIIVLSYRYKQNSLYIIVEAMNKEPD